MTELTTAQKAFIAALQAGKTPSLSPGDRTGKALERMGLARYAIMVGWIATAAGFAVKIDREGE